MILVRSPLRITLGGGGTDLPSYYRAHGGFCLTAAIDHYVYVAVTKPFEPGIYLKYSELEKVSAIVAVGHPIIRAALHSTRTPPQVEITTLADIPAGTGLGSSSSFTTALLQALHTFNHRRMSHDELAGEACDIEIDCLRQTIGKQDQYAAAFGGISSFEFCADERVRAERIPISKHATAHLEDHLLLFFTGYARASASVLLEQQQRFVDDLHEAKLAAKLAWTALVEEDWPEFARTLRLRRAKLIPPEIYGWLEIGEQVGASGKLVGAGEAGFLLFYAPDPIPLRQAMGRLKLPEVRFRFDHEGTKVLLS